jgi:transcriptional/translational regulatory protein YebC/TACO1
MVAPARGGGDPNGQHHPAHLLQKARAANMPNDNIDRAIKRAPVKWTGAAMEEIIYEGYAPAAWPWWCRSLSDNKNRTASEIRNVFSKFGGNLATQGAVTRGPSSARASSSSARRP